MVVPADTTVGVTVVPCRASAERADGEDLVRQLDRRVDPALGLEPGVRGAPEHLHLVERNALALDLERPAVGGRLEHERGDTATRLVLDETP